MSEKGMSNCIIESSMITDAFHPGLFTKCCFKDFLQTLRESCWEKFAEWLFSASLAN